MNPVRFWVVSLVAAAGTAATFSLGLWQLDRAHQREALSAAIEAARTMPPLPQEVLLGAQAASLVHRPVRLRGRWDAGRTIFLDNRQMGQRVGFYVVTPLLLSGSDRAVLVQRGWAPRNFERRESLPSVQTPAGEIELTGRIAPPPSRLYQPGPVPTGPIRQNLEVDAFAAETGLHLLPLSVQQTGPASEGLLREWPVTGGRGPETNYGYAVQWWALSALIACLYAWFQFIHPRRRPR